MTSRARLTSKPIPVTPISWQVEVDGVRALLLKLRALRADNGDKWVSGVGRYYRLRLRDLLANKPRNYKRRR